MKKDLLTVKELAAELRMSPKSNQRAYRKEEIPMQWLGRMARFNLAKVQRAMERNGRSRMRRLNGNSTPQGATAGASRRREQQKLNLLLGNRRKVEMLFRLSILVLAMATSGCATIIDGSSQPVTFNSSPNGARIYVNGMEVGTTPLIMPVKRSKTTMILAKKNGYEDQQLLLQTKVNTYFWGNILFYGGLFSSTTDYASDAMIEYSPNMYYITLNPIPLLQSNNGGIAVERGVRTRIEQVGMRTERQVRTFILRYHADLTADISRGQGEYFSSLYTMLHLP